MSLLEQQEQSGARPTVLKLKSRFTSSSSPASGVAARFHACGIPHKRSGKLLAGECNGGDACHLRLLPPGASGSRGPVHRLRLRRQRSNPAGPFGRPLSAGTLPPPPFRRGKRILPAAFLPS